jgi:predicted MPP superfamily phosphohydrolase
LKALPVFAIAIIETFLCLAHWFMYRTWLDFWPMSRQSAIVFAIAMLALSFVFVSATLLGFRSASLPVKVFYRAAATWMGFANFLFVAAILTRLIDLAFRFTMSESPRLAARPCVAASLLALALATGIYGLVNARVLRVRRIGVKLPNLPPSWHGREALLISDMHLGHVNGSEFTRRIATLSRNLDPAVIFLAGDIFDGTRVDAREMIAPFRELNPPLGTFFVGGNHEEFGGAARFEEAVRSVGIRVLHNECETVDGVRIVGAAYGRSSSPLRAFLETLDLHNGRASILLKHVPDRLPAAEHAGISLQVSGHTHGGGQIFPFNFITRRAFGRFTYGPQQFGEMQVYTSSGAGTWGPPMRVGTHSEVVLLTFAGSD